MPHRDQAPRARNPPTLYRLAGKALLALQEAERYAAQLDAGVQYRGLGRTSVQRDATLLVKLCMDGIDACQAIMADKRSR